MNIELHLIQNFPPSNLNRDDTGSPKDAEFGGVRRGRISSQCLKRSIRLSNAFQTRLAGRIAKRTKKAAPQLVDELTTRYGLPEAEASLAAEYVLGEMLGWDDKKKRTKVLFYAGADEIGTIAGLIQSRWSKLLPAIQSVLTLNGTPEKEAKSQREALTKEAKEVVAAFQKDSRDHVKAADVALFGRMLAETPTMNIDAACQVAHAISTNKVTMDFDYFTAVDDLNPAEETGAGMIGTVPFNSACFYRYSTINLDQLTKNLGGNVDLAIEATVAFLEGAIQAIPSGKQNTFAAHTPPLFVMVVVRPAGMPVSLVNAFEKPVRPDRQKSLVQASVEALDQHWKALSDMYALPEGTRVFVKVMEGAGVLQSLKPYEVANVSQVFESVASSLQERRSEEVPA